MTKHADRCPVATLLCTRPLTEKGELTHANRRLR